MNKQTKIIIGIIATLATIGIGVGIYFSTVRVEEAPGTTSEEVSEEYPMYTTMEDGETITSSDIQERRNIEELAQQAALDYFKKTFPDSTSMSVRTVEWYFTDDNDSDNVLVTVTIVDENKILTERMRVIEIETSQSGEFVVKNTYEPDDRYSL